MKYNKIAMLVAGGLMVGASGTVFGTDLGTISGTVEEFGSLVANVPISSVSINATGYNGSTALSALDGDAKLTFSGCVENNSSVVMAANVAAGSMFSEETAVELTHATGDSTSSGAHEIGGFQLILTQNKLMRTGGNASEENDVIKYKMYANIDAVAGSHGHKDTTNDSTCDGGVAPISVYYKITDSNTKLYAGDYALTATNTIVLSGTDDNL